MESLKAPPIIIIEEDTYTKRFRLRIAGKDDQSVVTTVPRDVIRKEARKHGLSIAEFVGKFKAEWLFNDFGGTLLRFIPKTEKELNEDL